MSDYLPQGISITNQCYDCMQLDTMCADCQDSADARAADIAHELVDEGNLQYKHQWSRTPTDYSASDWIDSVSYLVKPAIMPDGTIQELRYEFIPPIYQFTDGSTIESALGLGELWELEDYTQRARETECKWCHILTPKLFPDCQSCDKPLELNA